MSKAFTKEDSSTPESPEDSRETAEEAVLPQGFKNYLTPSGAKKLKDELHQLLTETRPELVRTVSWAASNGDRSENGDYIYGKRRLREIDRRIRFLTKRLEGAEVVHPPLPRSGADRIQVDRVRFGCWVRVKGESDQLKDYQIVGIDETDVSAGKISWISPLAKCLLNIEVGETVLLRSPKGEEELEVVQAWYGEK